MSIKDLENLETVIIVGDENFGEIEYKYNDEDYKNLIEIYGKESVHLSYRHTYM